MDATLQHYTCDNLMNVVIISHQLFNGKLTHGITNITNGIII
jgi:hypothetical protein